jgi:cystathionine gamma-synthase
MRDLLKDPLWQSEDLGKPIPDSEHAVSVALPLWEHVIGYEEKDQKVLDAMWCGYPRFVIHPYVADLNSVCENQFARPGERSVCFPTRRAAECCAAYVKTRGGSDGRIDALVKENVFAITLAAEDFDTASDYKRYSGEIVSSRMAQAALEGKGVAPEGARAKAAVISRLADLAGQPNRDVFLFPSGMAATTFALRMVRSVSPDHKTVQLGFPYVDVLKVQNELGVGAHFFSDPQAEDLGALDNLLGQGNTAAVFTEFPNNTLMRCVDMKTLSHILRQHKVPLIVDDTIGGVYNVDAFRYADAVTTSLTKYIGGQGDVMAGSVVLNANSPFYSQWVDFCNREYEDCLWSGDAVALEENSRDYPQRKESINNTAEVVFEYLNDHPKMEQVYTPRNQTTSHYEQLLRPGRGYGGLMSILLKDAPRTSPSFYDALRVSKGPTLGTNYTLACPYTLLAHYDELDWAESCGISRYLIRISIGLEDPGDLIQRFESAFSQI